MLRSAIFSIALLSGSCLLAQTPAVFYTEQPNVIVTGKDLHDLSFKMFKSCKQ